MILGEQAGPPNEDEIYEVAIAETFAVYAVENALLVPVKEYWGRCPKTEVLDPNKVCINCLHFYSNWLQNLGSTIAERLMENNQELTAIR